MKTFHDVFFKPVVSLNGSDSWIEMPVFRFNESGTHMSYQEYYLETIGLDGENYEDYREV
ncbi:hypothetical protein phiOC_p296 [Ochrobactrum phage vB_OspM_OC]|nr:hypothetical protein phiOC_p296 [Ochrobactrum phage vB_OspM_OC]